MTVADSIEKLLNTDIALKALIRGIPVQTNTVKGEYKWIDISTNLDTMIGFVSGLPNKPDVYDKKITFLVLQTYNQVQTDEIGAALSSSNKKSPGVKFSSNGTLLIDDKIYYNGSNPSSKIGDINRDANEIYYNGNILSWDSKKIFSQDLKYILWFDDKDKLFNLLYNPIHRKAFKDYYRLSLLNGGIDTDGYPTKDSQIHDVLIRYCNAFTVNGKQLISQYGAKPNYPEIYSDPFCGVMLDPITSVLNSSFKASMTSSYYKNKLWTLNVHRDMWIKFFIDQYEKSGNYNSWACPFNSAVNTVGSLRQYAKDGNFFSDAEDKTFIADLARLDISAHTSPFSTALSAHTFLQINGKDSLDRLPSCGTGTTVNCNQILVATYGNISNNTVSAECTTQLTQIKNISRSMGVEVAEESTAVLGDNSITTTDKTITPTTETDTTITNPYTPSPQPTQPTQRRRIPNPGKVQSSYLTFLAPNFLNEYNTFLSQNPGASDADKARNAKNQYERMYLYSYTDAKRAADEGMTLESYLAYVNSYNTKWYNSTEAEQEILGPMTITEYISKYPITGQTKPTDTNTQNTKPTNTNTKPFEPKRKTDIPKESNFFKDLFEKINLPIDWKPMYTYILIALIVLIILLVSFFFIRKSSNSGVSAAPLEAVTAFGRYMYR